MLSQQAVEVRMNYIRRAWDLEELPYPPFIVRPRGKWYATRRFLEEPRSDLEAQMKMIEEETPIDDYAVPALYTGVGIAVVAAAFGGKVQIFEGDKDPWTAPLINDVDPQNLYKFRLPDPHKSGMNPLVFERIRTFQEGSTLPLRVCNIPSPLTIASQVWDYTSFLTALYEYPKEVHHLLDLATEATIEFVKAQLEKIHNPFGLTHEDWYIPRKYGLRVSDDVLAEISPAHYREFAVPYNNRLSEEFGGIFVHSCGDVTHNLEVLKEIRGLRGIEVNAPQNHMEALKEKVAGRMVVSLRCWSMDWVGNNIPALEVYTKELIDYLGTKGLLLQIQTSDIAEAHHLAQAIKEA